MPSDDGHVSQVHVFQDDGEITISGKVQQATYSSSIHKGHVNIAVIATDGTIIQEISTPDTPSSVRRLATAERSFSVHLKFVPAQGTKIRMVYRPH